MVLGSPQKGVIDDKRRQHTRRLVTCRVQMAPTVQHLVLERANLWVVSQRPRDREYFTHEQSAWTTTVKHAVPSLPFEGGSWKAMLGGISFLLQVQGEARRAVAIFDDPQAYRNVIALERTHIRRAMYLLYVEGEWWARMRYESKEKYIEGRDRHGAITYTPIGRRKRRWQIAPADWPRDQYGAPLSDKQVARLNQANLPGGSN